MILDVSYRTDIPAFYSEWFMNRVEEGFLYQRNPSFPTKVVKIKLDPSVIDVMTFCSKNYTPIINHWDRWNELIESKFRTFYYYTITPYGHDVEKLPTWDYQFNILKKLSDKVGPNRIGWRYDPILLTEKYTINFHFKTFEEMLLKAKQYCNRCIVSFVQMYEKTKKNMPEIIPMTDVEKVQLLERFGQLGILHGVKIYTCGHGTKYANIPGIYQAGCQTAEMFEDIWPIQFIKKPFGNLREGCLCMKGTSIGDYHTCLHGCKYCYATKNKETALKVSLNHNTKSPYFIDMPNIDIYNDISEMKQESWISKRVQLNLFE